MRPAGRPTAFSILPRGSRRRPAGFGFLEACGTDDIRQNNVDSSGSAPG